MSSWFTNEDKKYLSEAIGDYSTIIIDPIGETMEKLIKSETINGAKYRQNGGDLTMAGWGKVKDEMRSIIKWLKTLNKNIVIVAHVDEKNSDDSIVKRPLIATKIGDELIALVDVVGYLDIVTVEGEQKRVLRVNPDDGKYIAKDRTGTLPPFVKPEYNYILGITNPKPETKKASVTKKA